MNHDDLFVYVFVRQDLTLAEQLVHAAHAAYHMGNLFPEELQGLPSIVVVGTPHPKAFDKVIRRLAENGIAHYVWSDPDTSYGPTAIATEPLNSEEKLCLANYRLWSHSPAVAQSPAGEAKAAVAQSTEHLPFRQEVGGSIPSSGSRFDA